jgi:DNA-binding NarL/FixJ family response regulator
LEDDPDSLEEHYELICNSYNLEIGAHEELIKKPRDIIFHLLIIDFMIHSYSEDYKTKEEVKNINFPGIPWRQTGLEFLRQLRKGDYENYGFNRNIKVIVITGVGNNKAKIEAEKIGINGYLEKPVSIEEFEKKITHVLDL